MNPLFRNKDMMELILSVLELRGEERRETLVALAEIVLDTELDTELESLYSVVEYSDNPADYLTEFELVILRQVYELLRRMGVEFTLDTLHESPHYGLWVFDIITYLEDCEELDHPMIIVSADAEPATVLTNLVETFIPDTHGDMYSAIEHVEPRFIRNIDENLTRRKQADVSEADYANKGRRLLRFLLKNENLPFFSTFENFSRYRDIDQLLAAFDLSELPETVDAELVAKISIASMLAMFETYDLAYPHIEKVVRFLDEHADEEHTLHNFKLTAESLAAQYEEPLDE